MERHILFRIYEIDRMLRRKEYPNCTTLKKYFQEHNRINFSERTILRDIETMRNDLGADIRFDRAKNGYYYGDEKFTLPNIKLSEGELLAILLGAEIMRKYENTPFEPAIKKAFEKLQLLLPDTVAINPHRLGDSISFDITQTRKLDKRAARIFAVLLKAIKNKSRVEVNYYVIGRNAMQKRVIDPYHLRNTRGGWYLIGYCHLRKNIRTFAVNQIKTIKLLKEQFVLPEDFSVKKFMEHSWGISQGAPLTKIVVKLDKAVVRWFIDRKLHPSQKTHKNRDGSLVLTFKVAGTDEIKKWILSQGSQARVVEPKNLKDEIKREARKMAGL